MTNDLSFRCKHCAKQFRYESEKKRHELSHSPRFQCDICTKKFSFISALKRHEKQHQRKGKVYCKQCSRSFRDESLLQRHIKYAHKGKYICKKCNAEFHSELALSTHKKIHNTKSERKYHCRYSGCGKRFNFPHHLKHHEMTHTNAKQHHCQICQKGFIQSHHLKSHMKMHEPEKWLQCTEINCKRSFPTEYSRKRHLSHVHNIKLDNILSTEVNQNENFQYDTILCTACGETVDLLLFKDHHSKCSSEVHWRKEKNNEQFFRTKNVVESKQEISESTHFDSDRDINDCKSALGSCIMNGDSSENCLCAQMKTNVNSDHYENNVLDVIDENVNSTNIQSSLNPIEPYKPPNEIVNLGCMTCECRSNLQSNCFGTPNDVCNGNNIFDKICASQNILSNNTPDIEYKIDGSIKLKNTFDLDITGYENVYAENNNSQKYNKEETFVPFKSCEAVLGKCIVNGTTGDDCLCAKMLVDEQLMSAEEIDEITPHPAVI